MRYFMTGATGYLGSRIASRLRARGDEVLGLARSPASEQRLIEAGIEPRSGDLAEPSSFLPLLDEVDGVILTAFDHEGDWFAAVEQERAVARAVAAALAGTHKPLVATTATGVVGNTGADPVDESFAGQADFPARPRMAVEDDLKRAAEAGVRTVVIRPAILLHGHGGSQFAPLLVSAARTNGVSGYPAQGTNRIAAAHVDDVADLYLLALDKAPTGAVYNAAGADVSTRELAEAASAAVGGVARVASVTPEEATELWGFFPAMLLGIDNRTSGLRAREELGWKPYARTPSILEDLASGSYALRAAA